MLRATKSTFREGRVKGYLRGRVWYLCYHEGGRRRRPRVGADAAEAKSLAAQVNAQLQQGLFTAPSFEPVTLEELRRRWLEYHEHVRRSSVQTINRYRTATEHLLTFARRHHINPNVATLSMGVAEQFVRHLRQVEVAPNGHKNSPKRRLRDKGVCFVLSTCRSLFAFAARRKHLPPYADNPFAALELGRIPVEDAKPIVLFTAEQEREFLRRCDLWQFPIFFTLMLTGLRPGELAHLLVPDDIDLVAGVLRVRNKPALGWKVKTRSERELPLHPVLAQVLEVHLSGRKAGAVFLQRRCA
jgi:integrase